MSDLALRRPSGPNDWLVDEIYERYRVDPSSVSEMWRDFFDGYQRARGNDFQPGARPLDEGRETRAAQQAVTPSAAEERGPTEDGSGAEEAQALKGPAAVIARNMAASREVPTATSVRVVPAKLLEVNRRILNGYLSSTHGGKVSFTHLIGYAVAKALGEMPVMNSSYTELDDKPAVIHHAHIGLGLAVDIEKPNGSHTLLVPVIKNADTLDFRSFWVAYESLIRKSRNKKLGADDLAGATASLTNPGTIGTVQSVPRLMPGQGVIIGVGAIDYPAEFQATDPAMLAKLGVSKSVTITSTYDHRIIQGAESGLFLEHVHRLLLGDDGFYDDVFRTMALPYEPARWRPDINPVDTDAAKREKQAHVQTLVNMYRVRGHLIADLDPLRWKEPHTHAELDPASYGLTIWDLDREFFVDGFAGHDHMPLGDLLGMLRDTYCRTIGIEYMHIQEPDQKTWIQDHVEGVHPTFEPDDQRHILERLNAAEAFEKFLGTKYIGHKRFGIDGSETAIAVIDAILSAAADDGLDEAVMGMAHRGRLNVLVNVIGKSVGEIFREFEGYIDPDTTQGSGDVNYHKGSQAAPSASGNRST